MTDLISVIIPNYNHATYLKNRIDSVLGQSYQQIELIILDDCSPDNSREVIEQYRNHPKVSHIVYNDQNSGSTFRQWKKGLNMAKAEWVWIAESDDFAAPDFLEKLAPLIGEKTGLVHCAAQHVSSSGEFMEKPPPANMRMLISEKHLSELRQPYRLNGIDKIKRTLIYYNAIENASGVLVRKELALKYLDESIGYKLCGDWLLWMNILSESGIAYIPEPLNYFRQHVNNVRTASGRSEVETKEIKKVRNSLDKHIDHWEIPEAEKKELKQLNRRLWGINLGYLAMANVRNGLFWNGLKKVVRATLISGFRTGFIKDYLYWVKKSLTNSK